MRRGLGPSITLAAIALVLAIGFAATRVPGLQGRAAGLIDAPAPELSGIEAWLNTEPRTLAGLRGSVVLIDFWTYSCINCLRTFPFLRSLHKAYGPYGLEVIGVHSPEFTFEHEIANVRAAIRRHQITYPVALDNQMQTWRAYRNRFWPRVYLIDARGRIRFDHIGEGGEAAIQQHIRSLMEEAGLDLPPRVETEADASRLSVTPEIYLGSRRGGGSLSSPEGYADGEVTTYTPTPPGSDGTFSLEGPWRTSDDYVEAAGPDAHTHVPYSAREVFVVAAGSGTIDILLDGRPVPEDTWGADVTGSRITVRRSDLYAVLRMDRAEHGVLSLAASPGVRLYTFTFG